MRNKIVKPKKLPKKRGAVITNPYERILKTRDVANELVKWDVTEQKLRMWRMDSNHPLPFYKRGKVDGKGHCFYRWEDVQAFKRMIKAGSYIP